MSTPQTTMHGAQDKESCCEQKPKTESPAVSSKEGETCGMEDLMETPLQSSVSCQLSLMKGKELWISVCMHFPLQSLHVKMVPIPSPS